MDDTVGRASGYMCLASVAAIGLPVQAGSVAFIPMAVQRCCTRNQDPSKLSFQPHTDFQIATSELSKESATQHVASLNLTRFIVYRARLRQADFLLWAALDSVPMGGSRRGASRAKLPAISVELTEKRHRALIRKERQCQVKEDDVVAEACKASRTRMAA